MKSIGRNKKVRNTNRTRAWDFRCSRGGKTVFLGGEKGKKQKTVKKSGRMARKTV